MSFVEEVSCFRKRRYPTRKEAMRVAQQRMAEGSQLLRAYPCHTYGGWHLTKQPEALDG